MDIQFEKSELIRLLEETSDESVIMEVKKIFTSKKKDFWDELTPEQKFEIEESEREIDRGEYFLYEDIMSKYRK